MKAHNSVELLHLGIPQHRHHMASEPTITVNDRREDSPVSSLTASGCSRDLRCESPSPALHSVIGEYRTVIRRVSRSDLQGTHGLTTAARPCVPTPAQAPVAEPFQRIMELAETAAVYRSSSPPSAAAYRSVSPASAVVYRYPSPRSAGSPSASPEAGARQEHATAIREGSGWEAELRAELAALRSEVQQLRMRSGNPEGACPRKPEHATATGPLGPAMPERRRASPTARPPPSEASGGRRAATNSYSALLKEYDAVRTDNADLRREVAQLRRQLAPGGPPPPASPPPPAQRQPGPEPRPRARRDAGAGAAAAAERAGRALGAAARARGGGRDPRRGRPDALGRALPRQPRAARRLAGRPRAAHGGGAAAPAQRAGAAGAGDAGRGRGAAGPAKPRGLAPAGPDAGAAAQGLAALAATRGGGVAAVPPERARPRPAGAQVPMSPLRPLPDRIHPVSDDAVPLATGTGRADRPVDCVWVPRRWCGPGRLG